MFRNSRFTDMTRVDADLANANIVFDHDTFDGIDMCSSCYEGRLTVRGSNSPDPVGVAITNSHFGAGGQSDGVQLIGGARGVQIGPGNEFSGLRQSSGYTAHVDPIQLYGETHTVVTGNYFHGNSTGIMAGDGTDHLTVTNNVFVTDGEYPDQVVIGGGSGDIIRHNTLAGGASVRIGAVNVGPSAGETVADNVLTGGIRLTDGQSPSAVARDYNMVPDGVSGSHDIRARPVFSGGASPAGYAGFALAAGSPGTLAASDGLDMGIALVPGAGADRAGEGPRGERRHDWHRRPAHARAAAAEARPSRSRAVGACRRQGRRGRHARVELRVDGRRVAARVRRPYSARRRVTAGLRHGAHTVSARAVDSAGQVSSVAVAISRGRVLRGRVVSAPSPDGRTELRSVGFGGRRLVVHVAKCTGGPARRVTMSHSRTRLGAAGLCLVSVVRR